MDYKEMLRVKTTDNALVELARAEVNEHPERRQQDILTLRNRIQLHPVNPRRTIDNLQTYSTVFSTNSAVTGVQDRVILSELKIQTDDAYLLRFLRASCFDHENAFTLIHKYFEMKADERNKQLFSNMRPSSIKHVLEAGVTGEYYHRDKLGRRVIVIRPGKWDPSKFSITDIFKTNFMTLFKFVEEEETQIKGVVALFDMNGVGFGQMTHLSPFFAKRITALLQESFPMRLKAMHFVNEPAVFDYLFAILKQFMSKETIDKIKVHGHNLEELAEYFDVELLPEEYGGKGQKYSNERWMKTLLACDAEFDAEARNSIVKVPAKDATGTYRKIDS